MTARLKPAAGALHAAPRRTNVRFGAAVYGSFLVASVVGVAFEAGLSSGKGLLDGNRAMHCVDNAPELSKDAVARGSRYPASELLNQRVNRGTVGR